MIIMPILLTEDYLKPGAVFTLRSIASFDKEMCIRLMDQRTFQIVNVIDDNRIQTIPIPCISYHIYEFTKEMLLKNGNTILNNYHQLIRANDFDGDEINRVEFTNRKVRI